MISNEQNTLRIEIVDASPEERKQGITHSLIAALRWYAESDTRKTDDRCAVELTDLLDKMVQ